MSLLEVKNLCFSYGRTPFLENLSFSVNAGEFISVIGANGSGKSTLFRNLCGELKPQSGVILYNDIDLQKLSVRERAREIACIYQQTACSFPFTCFEVVEMGLYPHKPKADKADRDFLCEIMERTDTLQFCNKLITELSGGEMQRVLLARALAQKPKLLLLDEAMSGFDIAVRLKMNRLLRDMTRTGMSVISIRHDIEAAFGGSDRIMAMKQGTLKYNDAPEKLLTEKFFSDIFNVKAEITDQRFCISNI